MLGRADVEAAATRIAPFITHTPVLRSDELDDWTGATVFVKAEHRQHAGAFKFRGATNAVQSLSDGDAARGVAAHSSGNHAAALACAARVRGIPANVVMPEASSPIKIAAVESYGGRITLCANSLTARRAVLADVLAETGAVEIHPFENPNVIAGAGTAALELVTDVPDLDLVVTPVGGGGLSSGTCLAVAPVRVLGASPVDRTATIADGLRTGTSSITQSILDAHGVEIVAIPETEIVAAVQTVQELLGETIEPSAAVAFAAVRATHLDDLRVGIICSGGNVTHP